MYKKSLLLCGLLSYSLAAIAAGESTPPLTTTAYSSFQKFDRQLNLGIGITSGKLTNGNSGAVNSSQFINLEIERLFDIGVWFDLNASLMTYYSQGQDPAFTSATVVNGTQPSFGGINLKLGYAFPLISERLLITPYAQFGRATNLSSYTMYANTPVTNITQDYFLSSGIGARLEYRLSPVIELYFDQNALYNASQAPTAAGLPTNDNYSYTSLVGAKFNLYQSLQLGIQGFYNNYYYPNSLKTTSGAVLVPQSTTGGLISIGFVY